MSVLCCHIPDFLLRLHLRRFPQDADLPLALLGGDDRLCAVSPLAQACGVTVDSTARQARMRCPDLSLRPLQGDEAEAEHAAFLGGLSSGGLPVEALGWGAAYLDLHWLATEKGKVQPFCAEIGRSLRHSLGEALLPALGWDSGKFTARAAAVQTEPGRMKLVDKRDEVRFLGPLPVTLLPLPPHALQTLGWLGIRTLGQYAQLPESAVWQRFGQAGKLAHAWARGRDNRPVQASVGQMPEAVTFAFDQPEGLLGPVLEAATALLRPPLAALTAQLRGIRRLRLQLSFLGHGARTVEIVAVEAVDQEARLVALLRHQLETLNWPGEVESLTLWVLESGELPFAQGMLFPELDAPTQPIADPTQPLRRRYGPIFLQAEVVEAAHPIPERRFRLHTQC
jgi:DNA polymerase-4